MSEAVQEAHRVSLERSDIEGKARAAEIAKNECDTRFAEVKRAENAIARSRADVEARAAELQERYVDFSVVL